MSDSVDPYRLEDQVGYLLRLASQRHSIIFQNRISNDLTPTQFSTLIRVAEKKEVSQNQLGRLAAMDIATIKGVVDRLKAKGLLQVTADPGCVRLTDVSVVGESPTERKGSHHFHREPCACYREVSGEASVAACAGQAIEPRNRLYRMRRDLPGNRRQHFSAALG